MWCLVVSQRFTLVASHQRNSSPGPKPLNPEVSKCGLSVMPLLALSTSVLVPVSVLQLVLLCGWPVVVLEPSLVLLGFRLPDMPPVLVPVLALALVPVPVLVLLKVSGCVSMMGPAKLGVVVGKWLMVRARDAITHTPVACASTYRSTCTPRQRRLCAVVRAYCAPLVSLHPDVRLIDLVTLCAACKNFFQRVCHRLLTTSRGFSLTNRARMTRLLNLGLKLDTLSEQAHFTLMQIVLPTGIAAHDDAGTPQGSNTTVGGESLRVVLVSSTGKTYPVHVRISVCGVCERE